MGSALHETNKQDLLAGNALVSELHDYLRHRAVIEQDLRRVGITDTVIPPFSEGFKSRVQTTAASFC